MKKNVLFLFVLISLQIHAQMINNIYSVPANPTTSDFVYMLVDCQFTSSGCGAHTQGQSFITANSIGAWALHCLGPLATICNYTDTFPLGILPAGNYTFSFQLDEGFGGPPCTPGIVAGPSDSYNFTVSVPTSEAELEENTFTVYPNPAAEELRIKNAELKIDGVEIYNTHGEKVFSQQPAAKGQQQFIIDVSRFSPGLYFAKLMTGNKSFGKMFSVQR
jgi:hypothetical protein